ncbi:MAG: acyltransferase [Methylophilus sp.]|nr:acyltransferase [Methylophilus sp.]
MKVTYLTLDALRGIAAIFVVIFHTGAYWGGLSFHQSFLAVDMFFILSGFVIAHAYEAKLVNGDITIKSFIMIRIIRLYPMYFISIFFAVFATLVKVTDVQLHDGSYLNSLIQSSLFTLLFLPSQLVGSIFLFPLNTPYWSVFYELAVNFFYGLIGFKFTNKVLVLFLLVGGFALIMLAYLHGHIDAGMTWRQTSILSGFVRSGFGIFLGVYLYRVRASILPSLKVPNWVVLLTMAVVFMIPDLGKLNGAFNLFAIFLVFPFCVLVGSRCESGKVASQIFRMLGQASYPLYLLHSPVSILIYFNFGMVVKNNAPYSGMILVAGLIVFSLLLEKVYDIPVRRNLTSVFLKRHRK